MSDSYQAIYDAVRSRISNGDIGHVVQEVARNAFDISWAVPQALQNFNIACAEHARPSAVYRPRLSIDGNQWCALYGENLQDGVAGFGDTPEAACAAFDDAWLNGNARIAHEERKERAHANSQFGVGT